MARRRIDRQAAARRKGRPRKKRPLSGWRVSDRGVVPGRVVTLTAARRRAATRRRSREISSPAGAVPPAGPGALAIDFHLATCVAGARAGGRVLMDYWGKGRSYSVQEKGRSDYVTIVDRESEEAILRLVHERFPDHSIHAEESAPREGNAGYRWYIDPLDGTTNFIHGYPLFSVSIGLADAQGMRAGAVYDPVRDEMFTAARGQGAFMNGAPIRVSTVLKLDQALLVTGIPFRSIDRMEEYLQSLRGFMKGASGIRRDGSAALDLAYVACGRYEGFWEMALSSWDVAAGSLIVQEAGGVVTDFLGRRFFMDSGDIVAANPTVHAAMARIVRDAYSGRS
jgi:myo-inositol-1(or 4)-monophosphatase